MSRSHKKIKTRAYKTAAAGVAAVVAMVTALTPMGSLLGGIVNDVVYADEQSESTSKVLTTIWNEAEIGTHTTKGSYAYDSTAKTVTIKGAGKKFDKASGNDDLYYAYFSVKGDVTISAKMSVSYDESVTSGMAGLLVRNAADEATSTSEAIYADINKNQFRYGYHNSSKGGANKLGTSELTDEVYVKIEIEDQMVTWYIATQANFSDAKTKSQKLSGIEPTTVGFFATEGVTATFSDVEVTSSYTQDGATVNKVVFDSETGELIPQFINSADYTEYVDGNTLETSADGNILKITQTRSSEAGNIRQGKNVDYLLFPSTTKDLTITADVTINSIASNTDKQGIAMGQFYATKGTAISVDSVHFQKNKVFQHTYGNAGTGNCGNPKTSTLDDSIGSTYTITYTKNSDDTADIKVVEADGTVLIDSTKDGTRIDLTAEAMDSALKSGCAVQYGFAFTGISVDLSNIKLINSDGKIVYDMNDYYIAVGVAPVISNATATVADDRESIALNWDVTTEGSGNVKYTVYVSKDGGEYTKVADSKVNSFTYAGMSGDGEYKFKIVPVGGDTLGTAIETDAVKYQTPLKQTELSGSGTNEKISLSWTAVDGATTYDLYRSLGSDGTAQLIKSLSEISYEDTDVTAEEPYYYYVIAKNDSNTSNPSETLQVLASSGHTGEYVYESEAATLTVTAKSNDTVTSDKASIAMTSDRAGTVKLLVNGETVVSTTVKANESFMLETDSLVQGRNDVEVLFTEEGTDKTTRKVFNFVSNPVYDIVVDASYEGTDGETANGYATYKTVQAAVESVPADNAESKVIFIKNGEYNERVTVTSPYVSLLGEDSEKTHIYYSAAVSEGTATGMWDRNAMYVDSTADGFTAENLTIENSFAYTNGNDQQADALCIVADQTACVNVRIIGYQDTLLTDSREKDANGNYEVTRQYFSKCYITGNVDFIYGAGTSYFDDCDIVARYTSYKSDGCYTAPRTYASTDYGYVFNNCRFLAEDGVGDGKMRLSRPWGADASTTFINCYMGRAVGCTDNGGVAYADMSGNSYKKARFSEYNSYGPGYELLNDRPLLSSAQAALYTIDKVLGDYDAVTVVGNLYKGQIDVTISKTEDTPAVEVSGTKEEMIDSILTDEQKDEAEGKDVDIVISVDKIDTIDDAEEKAVEKVLTADQKIGMYIAFNVNLIIGSEKTQITETAKALSITVEVPTELINTDSTVVRTYTILRIHDGKAEALDTTFDKETGKISFKSDKFSTYVLVYSDVSAAASTDQKTDTVTNETTAETTDTSSQSGAEVADNTTKTADTAPIALFVSLLVLGGAGVCTVYKKRRVN